MKKRIAIAGSGFAGAVIARELAETGLYSIDVFEERDHPAGNCHTERDSGTGIMLHRYGPHIFNTNREDVWDYVRRWGKFEPYINRVKAKTARGMFSLPINLLTINQFFGRTMNPREAAEFVAGLGDQSVGTPQSFEDQALKFLGRELYENFFRGYTKKQWGVDPSELPASILQRLPVRFNYDDNYYNMRFQGIPVEGYTALITGILDHPAISLHLRTRFTADQSRAYDRTFFTGPLDSWFNFSLGRLQYRSLTFDRFESQGDYQGNAVINYCEESVPFTRISEHKHFTPWEKHEDTVCFREFSKLAGPDDIPYYPLRLTGDKALLRQYADLAEREVGVTFAGRLATYRYLDMHAVIGESLDLSRRLIALGPDTSSWPNFSVRPD
ncbi:MAG: UDP-galactopyranose mutase [Verrucomicrobiaceae bacterium]|nr:MAG: UDP-galactopyranose mutase [Verrucomicrobiaceae bacterium]